MARHSRIDELLATSPRIQQRANQRKLREQAKLVKEQQKQRLISDRDEASDHARELTEEAEEIRNNFSSILADSYSSVGDFWSYYKSKHDFDKAPPEKPALRELLPEPDPEYYKPKITLMDKLFKGRIKRKTQEYQVLYEHELSYKRRSNKNIEELNQKILQEHEQKYNNWLNEKADFFEKQNKIIKRIEELERGFERNEQESVEFYFTEILHTLILPEGTEDILTSWKVYYDLASKILVVDYDLPQREVIPTTKTIKYVISRKEFTTTHITDKVIDQIYDKVLYQIPILITNCIYENDTNNQVYSVVFNGLHTHINKGTGLTETKCILSLQTHSAAFSLINIHGVDAKACFQKFKGISSAKLSEIVPVTPIIQFNTKDQRFIQSKEVLDSVQGLNLASIHWEEFEHLIRELFEKEFSNNGSEVKITQSSRDGGIDAVIFDPDPIRGGKFVIQAKRYTNIVGVSAVRDLYGTIMNEGASRGILVTTANYGSDSYEFAKDKPITLLNGSNLLALLEKHGYNARIDIKEAKSNRVKTHQAPKFNQVAKDYEEDEINFADDDFDDFIDDDFDESELDDELEERKQ